MKSAKIFLIVTVVSVILSMGGCAGDLARSVDRSSQGINTGNIDGSSRGNNTGNNTTVGGR